MAAKVIQVSDDSGSNYYTLPGNTGEFRDEVGSLEDTIFGQNFKSNQPNLIGWSMTANALYKGFAGYTVVIKKSGTSTTMTGEATTNTSGKTYQIDATTKRVWDRTATFVVYDGGVDHTSDVESIDFLNGTVTFASAYTVGGAVTIDGKYLPMTQLAKYRNFTLSMTQEAIDDTDIPTAQSNSGHRTHAYGIKSVGLEVSGVYASSNGYRASLVARDELVIEINPGGSTNAFAKGFFKPATRDQKGNVGELEEETASFVLTVPTTTLLEVPFRWYFAASPDLSTAVKKCLEAWEDETTMRWKYLSDGTNGHYGDGVISDISLSGGLEAMNEFSATLMGSGAVTAVP